MEIGPPAPPPKRAAPTASEPVPGSGHEQLSEICHRIHALFYSHKYQVYTVHQVAGNQGAEGKSVFIVLL